MLVLALDTRHAPEAPPSCATAQSAHEIIGDAIAHARRAAAARPRCACSRTARRSLDAIDLLAVVAGPGSFTGPARRHRGDAGPGDGDRHMIVPVSALEALAAAGASDGTGDRRAPGSTRNAARVFASLLRRGGDAVLEPSSLSPSRHARARGAQRSPAGRFASSATGQCATRAWSPSACGPARGSSPPPPSGRHRRTHRRRTTGARACCRTRSCPIYVRRPDAELARESAAASDEPSVLDGLVDRARLRLPRPRCRRRRSKPTPSQPVDSRDARPGAAPVRRGARLCVRLPGSRVAAFCACWLVYDELHINTIAVIRQPRRQGIATALMMRPPGGRRGPGRAPDVPRGPPLERGGPAAL